MQALISLFFFSWRHTANLIICIVSTVDSNFVSLVHAADFGEGCRFCCFSSCHSSAVWWYPTFCTSSQPPWFNNEWNASAKNCPSLYCFQGLCLFVLDIRGFGGFLLVFCALFNISLPYLLLLKILFGVNLSTWIRLWVRPASSQRNPATPPAPPRPWTSPHCWNTSLFCLNEKFHLEHRRHNKGQREENEGDEKPGGRERIN